MLKKAYIVHVFSFICAVSLVCIVWLIISLQAESTTKSPLIIHGNQQRFSGVYATINSSMQAEIDFMASIQNPDQITIFGSSELGTSTCAPYAILPNSLGIPVLAFGHGHHQSFSIFCELLAAYDYLENSKICVIISPTWFATEGTNTEAFLEYVVPNFQKIIATNKAIPLEYKTEIGKFIYEKKSEFTSITNTMEYFLDLYNVERKNGMQNIFAQLRINAKELHPEVYCVNSVEYKIDSFYSTRANASLFEKEFLDSVRLAFLNSITNNSIYVYDDYFTKYVLDTAGQIREGIIGEYSLENNRELNDFKLMIDVLHKRNADCSFIIQPLNPYYYENLDYNKPLIDSLTRIMGEHEMPYLNMYSFDTTTYQPGTLKDIMHLGEYGWLMITNFLIENYAKP